MANLPTSQGASALQALSGQPYADFGTVNVRGSQLFMNAIGRQMAVERGAGLGGAKSVALAEACADACDAGTGTPSRFGAWLSGIGSTGSVLGDGNAAGLTYTLGGTAFGIDYRLDPRFLVGIAGGYVGGTQWVNGFSGTGNVDALSVALYGSFTQGGFYADALAGYANARNRMQRVVAVPGLATGLTNGDTSANQFLGQFETGYKFGLDMPAKTSITPFGRVQVGSSTQAGFSESGSTSTTSPSSRRPPPRCAPPSAPTSPPASTWAAAGRSTSACGWAGCTSLPTRHGRLRQRLPRRRVSRSRWSAPRRSATARWSASRPPRRSATAPRCSPHTTAKWAAALPTMRDGLDFD